MPEQQLILDRYRIVGRAGAGGYATVQHAFDTRLKRDVAIKCIQLSQTQAVKARVSVDKAAHGDDRYAYSDPYQGESVLDIIGAASIGSYDEGDAPLLPHDPGFLSKRDERLMRQAERRAAKTRRGRIRGAASVPLPIRDRYGNGSAQNPFGSLEDDLDVPHHTMRFPGPIGTDSADIARLASVLPGSISGAGHTTISGIDGDAVEVAIEEFEDEHDDREGGSLTQAFLDATPARASHHDRRDRGARDPYPPPAPIPVDQAIPGLEEARTAAHLNDANIVTVYDCVVEGTMAYVIMEYVEGKTLARMMREMQNAITLDMIATVFTSVSHALEVAHKAGVLHLDIKPENVIINRDGLVKVADFGLSTLMDASGQGTTGGGTIGYMPLEQMRQQPLDVRTDEWALASLTYEMLSGANPFRARTLEGAEAAIENAELVLPSRFWDIDEEIDDVIFAALDPDLDERYDSIKEFSKDLAPYLGNVKAGKKQLAEIVVNGVGEDDDDDAYDGGYASVEKAALGARDHGSSRDHDSQGSFNTPAKTHQRVRGSLIDHLGERGIALIMRIVAVIAAAMVGAIALMNFRLGFNEGASMLSAQAYTATYGDASLFGLFTVAPLIAWGLMAVFVIVTFLWPRFGMPLVYTGLFVSLVFNQAWSSAFVLLGATIIWWWLFGRKSDRDCAIALLQPLFGSVGFAALVPPVAGALLDVRESVGACFMAAASAIVFASFGSDDVMGWEVWANFVVAVNPSIAGASIMDGLIRTVSDPSTWAIVVSWMLGAAAYSLFCWRGTRTFDILGSIVCAAFIIAGVLFVPVVLGREEPLSAMRIAGSVIPALIGVLLAIGNVPDRVRAEDGEYEDYDYELEYDAE